MKNICEDFFLEFLVISFEINHISFVYQHVPLSHTRTQVGPYKNWKNGIRDPSVTLARTYKNQNTGTRDPTKTGQPRPRTIVGPNKKQKTRMWGECGL